MHVGVISGSRADRGTLRIVYDAILEANHRASWIDLTHCQPVADGGGRSACAIRTGMATRETVAELIAFNPDWVMVLGDRHEILGATVGAYVAGYPIAHLSGGDVTEGSQDDCMRHAISKLAHMHFPDNERSAERLLQMGEEPNRVHVVGSPELDRIRLTPTMSREDTFGRIGLPARQRAFLVVFHPNTVGDTGVEANALYGALKGLPGDISLAMIGPNQDARSDIIKSLWAKLVAERWDFAYADEVEDKLFLSLLHHCDLLIGNSSSGFYEAPSFAKTVINVGDRQKGRIVHEAMTCCEATEPAISAAISKFLSEGPYKGKLSNPYGDGCAAKRIVHILQSIDAPKRLLRKSFADAPWGGTPGL